MYVRSWAVLFLLLTLVVVPPLIIGGPWAIGITALCVAFIFLISYLPVRNLYGDRPLRSHFCNCITFFNKFQIVRNGDTMLPKTDGDVLGPHTVIINPGSAVVMENGPKQVLVTGPDILETGKFEYARRTYDLRSQQKRFRVNKVFSSNMIPASVDMCVSYRLKVRPEVSRGDARLTPVEENIIRRIDLHIPDWEELVHSTVFRATRNVANQFDILTLVANTEGTQLESRIRAQVNSRLAQWGIILERVLIEDVQPQSDIVEAAAKLWKSKAVEQPIEKDNQDIWTTTQNTIRGIYQAAETAGISPGELQKDALVRVLKELADNVSIQITAPEQISKGPFITSRN